MKADTVAAWLVRCGAIAEEDRELYAYAVQSFLITIAPLLLAGLAGVFMGYWKQAVLLILPFMCMRKYSGGFHAKHAWTCMVVSVLLLVSAIWCAAHIPCNAVLLLVTVAALISLMVFSPVDSENKKLDMKEKQYYKKKVIYISVFFGLVCFGSFCLGQQMVTVSIEVGLVLSAGLQLPCVVCPLGSKKCHLRHKHLIFKNNEL